MQTRTLAPTLSKRANASLSPQTRPHAPDVDLKVELITHRFTADSRAVLESWYPGSALDMTPLNRSEKRTKFGLIKHVYDAATMKTLRAFFEAELQAHLPAARILYWT